MTSSYAAATTTDPASPPDISALEPAQLRNWLETMILIREFEETLDALSMAGKIPGGVHLSVGQEAVAVGAARALQAGDQAASGHRGHHHALAMGMAPRVVMAELFGKATGCVGGRGGTMHLSDAELGYIGGNGIVGEGLGLATGAALALMMQDRANVAIGFFGDGGASTGRVWESINLAAVWRLPLIAVCENNLYAVETPILDSFAGTSIADRATGFGLPSLQVDGQDVSAVHRAVAEARARAAAGDGPTFIEVLTYRYHGHSTGEVVLYRTDDEVERWRSSRDPIDRLSSVMTLSGLIADNDVEAILQSARATVQDAIDFADTSPWADAATGSEQVTGLSFTVKENP